MASANRAEIAQPVRNRFAANWRPTGGPGSQQLELAMKPHMP
jgi:hypothetical protein